MDYNVGEGDNMIQKYLCLMMTVNFIFHVIAWKKYINNRMEKGKLDSKIQNLHVNGELSNKVDNLVHNN